LKQHKKGTANEMQGMRKEGMFLHLGGVMLEGGRVWRNFLSDLDMQRGIKVGEMLATAEPF
jgi:hypothetical protein